VSEQLGFEQGLGDRRAIDRDERLAGPVRLQVDVAGQHLLAGAALAGDQHGSLGGGDLLGELDHPLHRRIAPHEGRAVGGDRLQHRGDQLGIGRERDVFLGSGPDRRDRGLGVGRDAAGHDRGADALGLQGVDEVAHRQRHVDHDQVGALGAQDVEALRDRVRLRHRGAAPHRDLGGGDQLAVEPPDHQEPHGSSLSNVVA
jgi:hypothetical protein